MWRFPPSRSASPICCRGLPLARRHRRHPVEPASYGRPGSKTKDGYFVGFPAIWNVVCLYLFALMPAPFVSLFIVAFFVVLTFVPILAVHPFRVAELRAFSAIVTGLWVVGAIGAVANPFPSPPWVKVLLIATAICLTGVGPLQTLRDGTAR
jgi:phosphatidylcholine synthase